MSEHTDLKAKLQSGRQRGATAMARAIEAVEGHEPVKVRRIIETPSLEPLAYSVRGAMAVSGLGRSTIFACLSDGRLQRVKVGKKTLIPRASLEALLSGEVA